MAYMSQEKKRKIKAALDPIMKEHGIKYSLSVRNKSTIVCTIKSGPVDFIGDYNRTVGLAPSKNGNFDVNPYYLNRQFTGNVLELITKIIDCLNIDNFDNSDIQTDYFCVGHYVDLNIGTWDKPYQFTGEETAQAA